MEILLTFTAFIVGLEFISDVQMYKHKSTISMASHNDKQDNVQGGFDNLFKSIMKSNVEKTKLYRNILEQESVRMQQDFDTVKKEFQSLRQRSAQKHGNIPLQYGKAAVVKRETQENDKKDTVSEEGDESEEEVYETKYPYPRRPVEMNWSFEMSTLAYADSNKVQADIGNLLTQLINTLSYGDPMKKQQLTLLHTWVPFKGVHCFDSLRLMLSMYCVEWKLSEFARRYGYVLVNMCNAKWLNEEDIEEAMAKTCDKKRIPDDKCM